MRNKLAIALEKNAYGLRRPIGPRRTGKFVDEPGLHA
jgi:hypothetical protein